MAGNVVLPSNADAIVIGGGIVGCAAAYYLAIRGVRTVLLEKDAIGGEQSSRAWGFVRQQGRHPAEVPLAKAASVIWSELAATLEADIEFVRGGILALAETAEDMTILDEGAQSAKRHGLSTKLIGSQEISALLPELAGTWRGALYTPDDGHAEPAKATHAFANAARRRGAVLATGTRVLGIEIAGSRVAGVRTSAGEIQAPVVICAAGIYAAQLAETLGFSLPVRLIRSSVAETTAAAPFTRLAVWAPKVAFRPTARGTFYLGNGYRGAGADYDITLASFRHLRHFLPSYLTHWRRLKVSLNRQFLDDIRRRFSLIDSDLVEPQVNQRKIAYNEAQFYRLFPHLKGLGLQRTWAGRMDLTPDMIPALGSIRTITGFLLAAGFSGHGFALGPIVGRLLSEMVVDGRSSLDIAAFDPRRFENGASGVARVGM